MFEFIWTEILFRPLLNILIGIYNTVGLNNLGFSIVVLSIITRIVLLPITVKDKSRRRKQVSVEGNLQQLQRRFANNPTVLRQQQRKLLKESRYRRWPKVVSLAFQGLILLVLYRVFLGGINLNHIIDQLYTFVSIPRSINTQFLGFAIDQRSFILSFLCGFVLFLSIFVDHKSSGKGFRRSDLIYVIGFPVATSLLLWWLPAVKAIFILVSLLFSEVYNTYKAFRETIRVQDKQIQEKAAKKVKDREKGLPSFKDRFN